MIVSTPGVYDIPENQYHADPVEAGSLSNSGAKLILPPNCPAIFHYRVEHPEFSGEMDYGAAAHKLWLKSGPEIVECEFDAWTTKAAKEKRAAARAEGKVPLLSKDLRQVEGMVEELKRHPYVPALFSNGKAEQSLFWTDEASGMWCRARLDWLPNSRELMYVPDYKTIAKASIDEIERQIYRFFYHMQGAFYVDGVLALGLAERVVFMLVFQERDPPYLVRVIQVAREAIATGRDRKRRALDTFAECLRTDTWPGYPEEPTIVTLPPWARED